jgi:hypothetical protein
MCASDCMLRIRFADSWAVLLEIMMKVTGFLLLAGGWTIVGAALLLLPATASRVAFVLAGLGVQILGLVLAVWAHRVLEVDRG